MQKAGSIASHDNRSHNRRETRDIVLVINSLSRTLVPVARLRDKYCTRQKPNDGPLPLRTTTVKAETRPSNADKYFLHARFRVSVRPIRIGSRSAEGEDETAGSGGRLQQHGGLFFSEAESSFHNRSRFARVLVGNSGKTEHSHCFLGSG